MRAVLLFVLLIVCAVIVFAVPTIVAPFSDYSTYDAGQAVLFCLILAIIVGCFVYRNTEHRSFLLQLFGWALVVRMLVATGIFIFNVQEFFGGDAITYDFFGFAQLKAWQGDTYYQAIAKQFMEGQASAWGMINMVAIVYTICLLYTSDAADERSSVDLGGR